MASIKIVKNMKKGVKVAREAKGVKANLSGIL
jgi:hypothetical protein